MARARASVLVALVLAGLAGASGCSPNPPSDGLYGCATGACPTSHPYCHDDQLCYAAPERDAGPRPDAYTPDVPATPGTVALYGRCAQRSDCTASLDCLSGFCLYPCTACPGGTVCAPVDTTSGPSGARACLVDCNPREIMCPSGTTRRIERPGGTMMTICHCVPGA
jgi:hypothetical protein